jgi:hypothetical protein
VQAPWGTHQAESVSLTFPACDRLLQLLGVKRVGSGAITFWRHRVVQQAITHLGLSIACKDKPADLPGFSGCQVTVSDIVTTWAGYSSLKSYRNRLKVLHTLEQVSTVPALKEEYLGVVLSNLSMSLEDICKVLTLPEPYPAGYRISWPDLSRAVAKVSINM